MELTIEQALQQGVAAHKGGKLQDAERLYRAILQSQPLHPEANHNLGVLAVSFNKADLILKQARKDFGVLIVQLRCKGDLDKFKETEESSYEYGDSIKKKYDFSDVQVIPLEKGAYACQHPLLIFS